MSATQNVSEVLAQSLGHVRVEKRLSARGLAALCEELGVTSIDRQRIANLENGRGRPMSAQEWIELAYVLDATPIDMLNGWVCHDDGTEVETAEMVWMMTDIKLTPTIECNRGWFSEWLWGEAPRPGEVDEAWEPAAPPEPTVEQAMAMVTRMAETHGLMVTFAPSAKKGRK